MTLLATEIQSSLAFLITLVLCITPAFAQDEIDFEKDRLLSEISEHVKTHFYEKTFDANSWDKRVSQCRKKIRDVKTLDQFDRIVNELLATLNTSHTYFFSRNNPKRYQLLGVFHKLFDADDKSLFCYDGIGVDTRKIEGKVYVVSVYDGLPADKAGIKFGDQIISVDGKAFHPVGSFRGKAKSKLTFELRRDDKPVSVEVTVENLDGRTMFESALQSSIQVIARNEKKIGYLHLWSYAGAKYQEQFREAILWGKLSQCDALIVDLRDGWGGADINNLNLFRKPIAIIKSTPRNGDIGSYSGVWERPVALLTNSRSTSGKELFAYGFKKLKLGKVIGERTAGAVVAGRIFKLTSGDVLYLAVNDVHVDGNRLEGIGVEPDVLVERPIVSETEDSQLKIALEHFGQVLKK